MTNNAILSKNVRTLRKKLGESQIEFAFNCGISTENLSLVERAIGNPTLDTIGKISAYTGAAASELLESTEPE